jgi:hypothetical protein
MASPFAASPSHLPLAAQRQLELELTALRRAVARAFTSLDVGRRKWAAQSESGKRSLSACLNGLTQLAYAEGTHWGALAGCTEMRRLVAVRALHKLQAAQAEVDGTLEVRTHTRTMILRLRLPDPVTRTRTLARHLPRRSAAWRPRARRCATRWRRHALRRRSAHHSSVAAWRTRSSSVRRPHAASAASATSCHLATHPHARVRGAVVHADALVASFEQELVLRRAVAAELRYGAVDEQRAAPHVIPLYVSIIRAAIYNTAPLIALPIYNVAPPVDSGSLRLWLSLGQPHP